VLQAQAISVEVGGRLLVDSASFTVMPRDKVGIVGRNGAGKTSLFRVLGGANEPKSGNVLRKGGFGYLPQDPKIDSALDGRSCVTHVLSGRGIDDEITRIEKLRIAMEENPDERNVTRYTDAEESFRTTGGYASESEARAMAGVLVGRGSWADVADVVATNTNARHFHEAAHLDIMVSYDKAANVVTGLVTDTVLDADDATALQAAFRPEDTFKQADKLAMGNLTIEDVQQALDYTP